MDGSSRFRCNQRIATLSLGDYSKEAIEIAYVGYLENVLRYSFTKSKYANTPKTPLERLATMMQDKIFSPQKNIPEEYLNLIIKEAERYISSLGNNVPAFIPISERTGITQDLDQLTEKLSKEYINRRNKQFPENSPERLFINGEEIRSAIKEATRGDDRFDDGAQAILSLRIQAKLKELGYI